MSRVNDIGTSIRELRKAAGLTQARLAEKIGVTYQMVQKYEKGKGQIGVNRLFTIAKALGVHISTFLGTDEKQLRALDIPEDEVALLRFYRRLRTRKLRNSVSDILQDIVRAVESR